MNYVKGARITMGVSGQYMADFLGLTLAQYRDRERGRTKFSNDERIALSKFFGWTPEQMNEYLFDGKLPLQGVVEW